MPFSTQPRARVHAANRLDEAEVNWRETSALCIGVALALHPPCRALSFSVLRVRQTRPRISDFSLTHSTIW